MENGKCREVIEIIKNSKTISEEYKELVIMSLEKMFDCLNNINMTEYLKWPELIERAQKLVVREQKDKREIPYGGTACYDELTNELVIPTKKNIEGKEEFILVHELYHFVARRNI